MKQQFLVLTLALLATLTANAQKFSGHYTIQSKEMLDGKEYLNAIAQEITVTQGEDSIKIVRVTPAGGDQTTSSSETLPVNGKPLTKKTASNRTRISTVSFDAAKHSLTITSTFSYADKPGEVEFRNTEVWTQQSDGTLTIVKTSDAAVTDDWTIRAIFKKQ